MTIKIEATPHELEKIKNLTLAVDTVLDGGDSPSWRDVLYEVQEMLAQAETREAEPLIKDEKLRKIIKEWAKVNEIKSVFVTAVKCPENGYLCWELSGVEWEQSISICFGGELPDTIEDLKAYTIEELCGSSYGKEEE